VRIALVLDQRFLRRENALLGRLEVGLADEGVRVVRVVPVEAAGSDPAGIAASEVAFEPGPLGIGASSSARQAAEGILGAWDETGDVPELDVVHCLGEDGWRVGEELAQMCGAGLALEAWRPASISKAVAVATRHPRGIGRRSGSVVVTLAGAGLSPVMERLTARGGAPLRAYVTPWGVHTPALVRGPMVPSEAASVALVFDDDDAPAAEPALGAVAQLARRFERLLVFVPGDGDAGGIWSAARKLGILDRVSLVGAIEGHREPLLHVDVLAMVSSRGEHRSLTLDAMASGVLVVSREDAALEYLEDGTTAKIVKKHDPAGWAEALGWALDDPEAAAGLCKSARAFTRDTRTAAAQVGAVLRVYRGMSGEEE
jgi:hypothetical protein